MLAGVATTPTTTSQRWKSRPESHRSREGHALSPRITTRTCTHPPTTHHTARSLDAKTQAGCAESQRLAGIVPSPPAVHSGGEVITPGEKGSDQAAHQLCVGQMLDEEEV